MKIKLSGSLPSLMITIVTLIFLDIVATSVIPALGLLKFRLGFHVLIILFMGFRLDTPFLAPLILLIQYVHSVFSVEGWAHGTFAGVLVCLIVGYAKDLLSFSSAISTIVVTQIFQTCWFLILTILAFFRTNSWPYVVEKFWLFIPESICLSLMSPLFFAFLNRVWRTSFSASEVEA